MSGSAGPGFSRTRVTCIQGISESILAIALIFGRLTGAKE